MKRLEWNMQTIYRATGAALVVSPFLLLPFAVAQTTWENDTAAKKTLPHHLAQCGLGNLVLMTGLAGVAVFAGLLLLYYGRVKRRLVRYLLIPSGMFFLAALFLLYVWTSSYFSHS